METTSSENKADLMLANDKINELTKRLQKSTNEMKAICIQLGPSYADKVTSSSNIQPAATQVNREVLHATSAPNPFHQRDQATKTTKEPEYSELHNRLQTQSSIHDKADSEAFGDFQISREQKRQMERRRKRRVVSGTSTSTRVRGAPLPSRDFFIYRVDKITGEADIAEYLHEKDIQARNIIKLSKDESMFNSFKLTVSISDTEKVMNPDTLPTGVRIRRFYERRTERDSV